MPKALWIGIVLSVLWVLFVGAYLLSSAHSLFSLWEKPPSEFGDFLSGIFAPLAFLWLAIAVFVQREELELQRVELGHNRQALTLQAEELRRTVEENAAQAKALEASKEFAREEVILHLRESAVKTLALTACDMWHYARGQRRATRGTSQALPAAASFWDRYANGDTDIWFAALIEALDRPRPEVTQQVGFCELATSFEDQCNNAQLALRRLNAPGFMTAAFDKGPIGEVRLALTQMGASKSNGSEG